MCRASTVASSGNVNIDNKTPIFVGGSWHSGTRMIVQILERMGVDSGVSRGVCSEDERDLKDNNIGHFLHDIISELPQRKVCRPDEAEFLRNSFARLFPGDNRWCVKAPEFCYMIPFLLSAFPGSTVIMIIRDGRDVAMSHLGLGVPTQPPRYREFGIRSLFRFYVTSWFNQPPKSYLYGSYYNWSRFQTFKKRCYFAANDIFQFDNVRFDDIPVRLAKTPPKEYAFAAKLWSTANEAIIDARGLPGLMELRYEDIIANPQKAIRDLALTLNLPEPDDEEWLKQFIRKDRVKKYVSAHAGAQEAIERIAGETLRKLSYL